MKKTNLLLALIAVTIQLLGQTMEDTIIGHSWYDLQSNAACQNRMYLYDDGTIGATWTFGLNHPNFSDRGTGYNYFDGDSWDEFPTERIESDRTGWPSYAPWGETGEIIISHFSGADTDALSICTRPQKGIGLWSEQIFAGPEGHEGLLWPRMVTGGPDHNHIYLISLTRPTANGGNPYQGIEGALLYSRSIDGGASWDIMNEILPGMDSSMYKNFIGDSYSWAEPKGNTVAFIAGSRAHDLFLMKSVDYGETFEKTVIWDHPYDQGYQIIPTDTFYCTDGSITAAIDVSGKVHVVFGTIKTFFNDNNYYATSHSDVDGLGYWNEDMPIFSSDLNALNPTDHPNSELVKNYNLIGWMQDVDGDSTINLIGYWGGYPCHGMSSMPQIVIDDNNHIYVVYSSVTETYDNGMENYRRLWMRASLDGGNSWRPFYHYLFDDSTHIFTEFSYISCAANSDENIYLLCQTDNEPGLNIYGEPIMEQRYLFAKIPKDEIVGINDNTIEKQGFEVSQNFPNPFSEKTTIQVKLNSSSLLSLEIYNLFGKKILTQYIKDGQTGLNTFEINGQDISSGIYFYTVGVNDIKITRKMIVQ